MKRRTTIELDDALLDRAMRALGHTTMRATVEDALRRAAELAEGGVDRIAHLQREYLGRLPERAELEVLESDEMWR